MQRRHALYGLHQIREAVLVDELRRQLLAEAGNLLQILGQNARLIVMEGVDVNGGVVLVGLDIVHLAPIHALRLAHGVLQGVAAGLVVPDHPPHHPQLFGADDLVVVGDDAGAGRHIDAVGLAA